MIFYENKQFAFIICEAKRAKVLINFDFDSKMIFAICNSILD